MKKVILLNKKEGETPLLALENFRQKNPRYLNVPMTYAGRLDPIPSKDGPCLNVFNIANAYGKICVII